MSYSPVELRDKDSNLDLRVQSAVSWPLDDPGRKHSVVHATRPRFDPGSLRHWSCRASSWRRSGARRSSLGGKCAGKSSRHLYSFNYRVPAGEDLSLSGGASMSCSVFFKLGITSLVMSRRLQTKKATLSDRPRIKLLCRYTSSGSNPQRGLGSHRTAANRRASAGAMHRSRHRWRPG